MQSPENFYATTHRYMQSFIKGGKKLNPDFEALNEIYVAVIGDNFKELSDSSKQNNENLVLIDVNPFILRSTSMSANSIYPKASSGTPTTSPTSTSRPLPATSSGIFWPKGESNSIRNLSSVALVIVRTLEGHPHPDESSDTL